MTTSLFSVALFLAALCCLPWALKWLRAKSIVAGVDVAEQSKIVSALAVGPHQRVVTIEVGPQAARVRLTLGVTPQAISLLHSAPVSTALQSVVTSASGGSPA